MVVLIAAFLFGALLAGLYTYYYMTPMYTSSAEMYMVSAGSQSVVDLTDLNLGQSLSTDYLEILKTRPIVESVIEEQGLKYSYGQVVNMLDVSVVNGTRIVKISVTSPDGKEAMNMANAFAAKGVSEIPKLMETPAPHIIEYAIVPSSKSSPNMTKNVLIGGLIALAILLAIFTVQFIIDDTYKTADDIEKEFGVMPLTVIPEGKIEGINERMDSTRAAKKARKKSKKKPKPSKEGSKSI
jgi:capsular polysaccharide biosynthesis protein